MITIIYTKLFLGAAKQKTPTSKPKSAFHFYSESDLVLILYFGRVRRLGVPRNESIDGG